MHGKLLVIDDDTVTCRLVRAMFRAEGLDVVDAHDGPAGVQRVAVEKPDVVLLDLQLPGSHGLDVLGAVKAADPHVPVIILTASDDTKMAVRAMRGGAVDYLTKPCNPEEIVVVVQRAIEAGMLRREVEELRRQVSHAPATSLMAQMGTSAQVALVADQVNTVAASNFTVLVLGETGTGKELVAQAIHQLSPRHRKPLVALDCGAIPEALLESELFGHERGAFTGADRRKHGRLRLAEGGTCLLDEAGNLPKSLQAKLLRVLESREVQPVGADEASPIDVRFVAATNDDLQTRVQHGHFRADLYFRLAQYTISLPPLRERSEDIPYLAQRFLDDASVELRHPVETIVPDALDALQQHTWPGNVRELHNVIRQALLHTNGLAVQVDTIRAAIGGSDAQRGLSHALPSTSTIGRSLRETVEQVTRVAERQMICDTLSVTCGNKAKAARTLRTDYKTLHLKMKALGIRARDFSS